ncbi:MAG: PIN domain-containing protein [Rhodospirillales bacterium]|nr:PIN domain-containing protein [Rhodospirillales bacterium]
MNIYDPKTRLSRRVGCAAIVSGFADPLRRSRFLALPVTPAEALAAGALDWAHRDPFDRLLAAQARERSLPLVSGDEAFRGRDIALIW